MNSARWCPAQWSLMPTRRVVIRILHCCLIPTFFGSANYPPSRKRQRNRRHPCLGREGGSLKAFGSLVCARSGRPCHLSPHAGHGASAKRPAAPSRRQQKQRSCPPFAEDSEPLKELAIFARILVSEALRSAERWDLSEHVPEVEVPVEHRRFSRSPSATRLISIKSLGYGPCICG